MDKVQDLLVKWKFNRFLDNVMGHPTQDKPLYNQEEFAAWMKSLREDPVVDEVTCYISQSLVVSFQLEKTPSYLKREGIFELKLMSDDFLLQQISILANRCYKESAWEGQGKHMMILPLEISRGHPGQPSVGHQNAIFVDFKSRTFERFEPYTRVMKDVVSVSDDGTETRYDYNESVDRFCRVVLKKALPFLENFEYISPVSSCVIGLQKRSHPGFCVVWTCMIAQLRLLFSDYTTSDIIKMTVDYIEAHRKGQEDPYLDLVKRYASYIQNIKTYLKG